MRRIPIPTENEAPDSFKRWKRRHPGAGYDRFRDSAAKAALKESLVRRQKFLCCYCESRIKKNTSHIEHIEPQMGGLSKRTMDYSNLAASCIRDPSEYEKLHSLSGADFSNLGSSILHCGHARGSHKVVSPYDPKCEHLFFYSFSGEVLVNPGLENSGDIRLAQDSIAFLRLNVPQLVSLRALAMFETLKLLDGGASEDDIMRELYGKLPPYISAAKTAARRWAERGKAAEE